MAVRYETILLYAKDGTKIREMHFKNEDYRVGRDILIHGQKYHISTCHTREVKCAGYSKIVQEYYLEKIGEESQTFVGVKLENDI